MVPQLIDTNVMALWSNPRQFTQLGDSNYFIASHWETGNELYRLPSPLGEPELVADLQPGTASSSLNIGGAVNDRVIFSTAINGMEIWSVEEGQAPVLLHEFEGGSVYEGKALTYGSELYFQADDGMTGIELWKTDGTPGSVTQVADLRTGPSDGYPAGITIIDGAFYFSGRDELGFFQLWKIASPGQPPVPITGTNPGGFSDDVHNIVAIGDEIFFSAEDALTGRELWKTDGTPGTARMVKDIRGGTKSSNPQWITEFNGVAYFCANESTVDGYELWRSDGTAEATYLFYELATDPNHSTFPSDLIVWNNGLYFSASNRYLMKTDGTAEGTELVQDIGGSQALFGARYIENLQILQDQLIYIIRDETDELWRSDGTSEGSEKLTAAVQGDDFSIAWLRAIGDRLYFAAGEEAIGTGLELWTSDTTSAGTGLLAEINPGTHSAEVLHPVVAGDFIYYEADDTLWRIDLATRTPQRVTTHELIEWTAVGDRLFFNEINSIGKQVLCVADQTTVQTISILSGSFYRSPEASYLTALGDELFFAAEFLGGDGNELWKTDGTSEGTVLVKDIFPSSNDSNPRLINVIEGILYFVADDGTHGVEWWRSDGTTQGTYMLADINPGSGDGAASIPRVAKAGGKLFVLATDGIHGNELWMINESTGETCMLKDIRPGSSTSTPGLLTPFNNELFFIASSISSNWDLWKTDGTPEGTVPLIDFQSIPASNPTGLVVSNGTLFFSSNKSSTSGSLLWKSDGTT
ncbi:MAG: hypothetical protein JW829_12805, partial [Pirellulales bacterium]|nr:hypothetical protein [Pirellulales bacterium]